jgi:hypothetical protein
MRQSDSGRRDGIPNEKTGTKGNSHQGNSPLLTLITCGYKEINQTYDNIDHVIIEDLTPPVAFAEGVISSPNSFAYCFLDQYSDFASSTVIEEIMQILCTHPELGGAYSDNIFNGYRQYYPSYFYESLQKVNIDTPFVCRKEVNVKFNPEIPSMYYYDALKEMGTHTVLHHVPQPLFTINNI